MLKSADLSGVVNGRLFTPTRNLSKKAVFVRSFQWKTSDQIYESSQPFLCGLVIDT